jgi:hypothetical protein
MHALVRGQEFLLASGLDPEPHDVESGHRLDSLSLRPRADVGPPCPRGPSGGRASLSCRCGRSQATCGRRANASRRSEGEHAVIVARIVKSVMVATVGLFGCMVAYNNCVDYDSNRAFVQHVLAMDTVFPFNAVKGRAITSPAVQRAA